MLLCLLSIAGCTGGTSTDDPPDSGELPNPEVVVGPDLPEFYVAPPPDRDARPGDLVWARPLAAPDGVHGYAILYWSTAADNSLVAVSGVLFEPARPASGPRPVLAWAHGPFGLGDACAPSQEFFAGDGPSMPIVLRAIQDDAVFVASDYQGLGTPGGHPYMVNVVAGRNVLDSIRAARQFSRTAPEAAIMGHAQGATAALLAAELQPEYAPELTVRGTASVSPPSNVTLLDGRLAGGPYFGYQLMTVHGYLDAYPELAQDGADPGEAGRSAVRSIASQCLSEILRRYAQRGEAELELAGVTQHASFQERLADNEPGQRVPSHPVLLVHGSMDDLIPVADIENLADRYCRNDATVIVREYADSGHVDVIAAALDDIITFLNARAAGEPVADQWTC